jgi:hypothetical protein
MHSIGSKQNPLARESFRGRCGLLACALIIVALLLCISSPSPSQRSYQAANVTAVPIVLHRPLVDRWTASAATENVSECEIMGLIEEGLITYAFDITCKAANKQAVRILSHSLAAYQEFLRTGKKPRYPEFYEVMNLILPPPPEIKAVELARLFSCSAEHMINLVRERLVKVAHGKKWGPGRNNSPLILRASIVEFLEERQIV